MPPGEIELRWVTRKREFRSSEGWCQVHTEPVLQFKQGLSWRYDAERGGHVPNWVDVPEAVEAEDPVTPLDAHPDNTAD